MRELKTRFTPEVRNYLYSQDWPKGLQYDIFEDENQLTIVFYRDNWITFGADQHVKIAAIVKEALTKLRTDGVPIAMGAMKSRYDES